MAAEIPAAMPLLAHLDELRRRVVRAAISVCASFALCYWQSDALLEWCQGPYRKVVDEPLSVIAVSEAFFVEIRVAFVVSLFLASPLIAWQAWAFVSPGLLPRERRLAVPFAGAMSLFFVAGGAFAYYVGLPAMLGFLIGEAGDGFELDIRAENYLSTFGSVLLGMGAVFEAPVLAGILARLGIVTPGFLVRKIRHAVVIIAILAALVTPSGDIPTMLVFAIPMLLLYGISILVAWIFARAGARAAEPDDARGG